MGKGRAKRPATARSPPLKEREEEEEEEKMEKFFDLIRSIKAARDGWRDESSEMKNKKVKEECNKAVWMPCFEREDFTKKMDFKSPFNISSTAPTSKRKEHENLDLNLSL
ncbi:hypothetical protein AAC387_Pa05g2975 [Persea americana]